MFVLQNHNDKILIPPSVTDKEARVHQELLIKYSNKLIPNHGIAITVKKIIDIKSYKIVNGYLQADVHFELILFRYFVDEVIYGKVESQEEDHIKIGLPFFDSIYVYLGVGVYDKLHIVPDAGTKHCTIWYWIYEGNKFYVENNKEIRVRIKEITASPYKIIGTIDGTGLGMLSWWL